MTQDHHYSDHPSHYVSPGPQIEPKLTAYKASMLPTRPPGVMVYIRNAGLNRYIIKTVHY